MLATHPEVYEKLQNEVDKTMEENDGKLTYEAIMNMKYLDMTISETLRIYPPASVVDRVCTQNYVLEANPPAEIFPGECIYIPIFGLHRDPRHFPEPEKFDPERFSDENRHNINPYTYLPFGVGPRSCIGNRFALLEAKSVLVYLLSKFRVQTVDKTPETIKIIQKGFNLSIEGGFWMGLQERNQ
ncbi:Cytochrome P450 9e2 [Blattella germanica]|nr:Cytochrome P450 9e2 [Blattella germanica]